MLVLARRRKTLGIAFAVMMVLVAAVLAVTSLPARASSSALAQMQGSATFAEPVDTVWAWTSDPQWVCSLIPGCVSGSSKGPVDDPTLTLGVQEGSSGALAKASSGTARITDRVFDQSLSFHYTMSSALGSFTTDAAITLTPIGSGSTRLSYTATSASGTGMLGRVILGQLPKAIPLYVARAAAADKAAARTRPKMTMRVHGIPRRATARGLVKLTPSFAIALPLGFTQPTASGRWRVYVGGKLACSARVVPSKGVCRIRFRTDARTVVTSLFTGTFSNGIALRTGSSTQVRR